MALSRIFPIQQQPDRTFMGAGRPQSCDLSHSQLPGRNLNSQPSEGRVKCKTRGSL